MATEVIGSGLSRAQWRCVLFVWGVLRRAGVLYIAVTDSFQPRPTGVPSPEGTARFRFLVRGFAPAMSTVGSTTSRAPRRGLVHGPKAADRERPSWEARASPPSTYPSASVVDTGLFVALAVCLALLCFRLFYAYRLNA